MGQYLSAESAFPRSTPSSHALDWLPFTLRVPVLGGLECRSMISIPAALCCSSLPQTVIDNLLAANAFDRNVVSIGMYAMELRFSYDTSVYEARNG